MNEVTEKAYAKINLTLGIEGKREDGYHLISSVMQTVDLFDEIRIRTSPGGINITCDDPQVPTDSGNTVYKAASFLIEKFNLQEGFDIEIVKNIPICAGLGGPSADAAATIRGINRLAKLGMDADKMREIAVKTGADVPFLIEGGRALCQGIGEILTPKDSERLILLLAKPPVKVSSKWAYEEFDKSGKAFNRDTDYYNDFESVVEREFPIIGKIKDQIKLHGARTALMSGSGSSVFGIFENEKIRDECYESMVKIYPDTRFIKTQTI